ncbi:MAG: hypothetical protein P4M11_11125 [Candidatus Pacebacteria bacterium]|nr:hypothetical protein [Candidatus Paceibacterota bacterium]
MQVNEFFDDREESLLFLCMKANLLANVVAAVRGAVGCAHGLLEEADVPVITATDVVPFCVPSFLPRIP